MPGDNADKWSRNTKRLNISRKRGGDSPQMGGDEADGPGAFGKDGEIKGV